MPRIGMMAGAAMTKQTSYKVIYSGQHKQFKTIAQCRRWVWHNLAIADTCLVMKYQRDSRKDSWASSKIYRRAIIIDDVLYAPAVNQLKGPKQSPQYQ
jgi:hypothetical protein